ncbi:arginine biosynthesis bifunctional protein [Artemisia annua]|uniref:Arginine biosynthesis bifunctional protein n=1 Tax=Artemisia annua TaxID=35608 RepID=A0A2U1Q2I2_ARTAN|nr:arginine biosynthesis bifunctional protein [Artemisia annua]
MRTSNISNQYQSHWRAATHDQLTTARAVLINVGQANAATGDAGYQDVIDCSYALAKLLQERSDEIRIESTGVIRQQIKKEPLLSSLPK